MIALRLVIDTNPARLYGGEPIMAEYREVLARPKMNIRKGLRSSSSSSARWSSSPAGMAAIISAR